MRTNRALFLGIAALVIAMVWAGSAVKLGAQQNPGGAVQIDGDDIGGVVTGPSGPEAGVWVIAETTDLPTRFARIVVTFQGLGDNSAESSYYSWVDQHNTFGLGDDVPMSTANLNDGLVALKDGKMILLRVPYPLGFYGSTREVRHPTWQFPRRVK